jgi:hypothetical protein
MPKICMRNIITYIEKAERMVNTCLVVNRMVRGLSVWDARTLYMARVAPSLISAADICPDVAKVRRQKPEAVQNHYLQRMLGITERSVIAVLFSETGLEPISYRRALLLLPNPCAPKCWDRDAPRRQPGIKGHSTRGFNSNTGSDIRAALKRAAVKQKPTEKHKRS